MRPSLRAMKVASADPKLFESLMARTGLKIVARTNDPLSTQVQEEAVDAIASMITEDTFYGTKLSPYHKQLKILAERAGYVVAVENCGPPGADPCEGDFDGGVIEVSTIEHDHDEEEFEPTHESAIEQVASLPIGTELAAQVMAVMNGEGTDNLMVDEEPPMVDEEPPMTDEESPMVDEQPDEDTPPEFNQDN